MQITNNRRSTGILIIILGVVLLAVLVYFFFFYDFSKTTDEPTLPDAQEITGGQVPQNIRVPEQAVQPTPSSDEVVPVQEDVRQLASSFAERFGSWSNQADSANMTDLKLFMTASMQAWADDYIATTRLELKDYEEYYGITTKAVVAEVKNYQPTQAEVLVSTKRQETKNNQVKDFNQDLLIKLVKPGKAWKVDSAVWQ